MEYLDTIKSLKINLIRDKMRFNNLSGIIPINRVKIVINNIIDSNQLN